MKKNRLKIFLLGMSVWLMSCSGGSAAYPGRDAVIPKPAVQKYGDGKFVFNSQTHWKVGNESQERVARQFSELFLLSAGFEMKVAGSSEKVSKNYICFYTDSLQAREGYHLLITPDSIVVGASSEAGFFYATQTLRQLLPPAIDAGTRQQGVEWSVPALEMTDAPRFGYRGFMLDVCRYFVPKEEVLKLLDYAGMLKINKFHFHLVDDNGWRLEIKKYPRLTEVGAWRVERQEEFPARKAPQPGEPTPIGGFYTQEDIREIVSYAASKSIEVIPEIEMPAHTTSSIAAYPWLACDAENTFVGVLPGFGGFSPVYCAGNDRVFDFLEDVIDELIPLFPSSYIHIGGDEATKEYWKKCPKCQARMKAEKLPHEEELQGYFMQRVNQYIRSKGKIAMGWDELTNSTLPEDVVVFGWRGMGQAALKAGKQGHPFVLTPAKVMYLIRYQGPQWFEPRTYFGNNTLADVYQYEPLDYMNDPDAAELLLGIQASMWCEFMTSVEGVEYQIFPRLTALAERAWCGRDEKDWENYLKRLDVLLEHFDYMGVNYARSMFNLDHKVIPEEGVLKVQLSCIRPDVEIRYTRDGKEPDGNSALFRDSLEITGNTVVKAATFRDGKQLGKTLALNLNFNKATARKISGNNQHLSLLVNGLKGSDKQSDFEWCGWYNQDGGFTIDLGNTESVHQVTLGVIRNQGMGVHLPLSVVLSASENGTDFTEIAVKDQDPAEIFATGIETGKLDFTDLQVEARYVKVIFKNPGRCPGDHPRAGQNTWVYFDEIVIN